ncbi:MAG: HEPN domain-containing protein [Halanaerobiales bacterium]|nr:HEPN domain-containing protein [Halanaerobiales bacterium]
MDLKLQKVTNEWFHFAENDLKAVVKLSNDFNAITCFHCQQSAEKYIKGLLLYLQINFKKSHDLYYLMELLDYEIPDQIFETADYLNEYAVETRYPGDYEEITNDEATQAINYAKLIKKFIIDLAN